MAPFSMTLMTPNPCFKDMSLFDVERHKIETWLQCNVNIGTNTRMTLSDFE